MMLSDCMECFFPNTLVGMLVTDAWELLLSRVGECIHQHAHHKINTLNCKKKLLTNGDRR